VDPRPCLLLLPHNCFAVLADLVPGSQGVALLWGQILIPKLCSRLSAGSMVGCGSRFPLMLVLSSIPHPHFCTLLFALVLPGLLVGSRIFLPDSRPVFLRLVLAPTLACSSLSSPCF